MRSLITMLGGAGLLMAAAPLLADGYGTAPRTAFADGPTDVVAPSLYQTADTPDPAFVEPEADEIGPVGTSYAQRPASLELAQPRSAEFVEPIPQSRGPIEPGVHSVGHDDAVDDAAESDETEPPPPAAPPARMATTDAKALESADPPATPMDASAEPEPETAAPVSLSNPADEPTVKLPPPEGPTDSAANSRFGSLNSTLTMLSGLGIVLAVFLLIAWTVKRAQPKAMGMLPSQVVEVLGRAPLAGRQQVYMLRCGAKLILVSVTPDGAETLTEITDPFEVDRLAGLCAQSRPGSSTETFRRVLDQYSRQGEVTHGA